MKIKIGIIFGGKSREREISFAGGRTVYDNLNKSLFEPIPLFADPFGNFILLDWQYIYKGSIRDFYPSANYYPISERDFQLYADSLPHVPPQHLAAPVGRIVSYAALPQLINFAFLTLHGAGGEDGSIQGLLQYIGIPYSASGILPSAIGMNKSFQKRMMQGAGFRVPQYATISRAQWLRANDAERTAIFEQLQQKIGLPMVVKAANQGSSIGVSKVAHNDIAVFEKSVFNSLFIEQITAKEWRNLTPEQRKDRIRQLCDLRTGIGLPVKISAIGSLLSTIFAPSDRSKASRDHIVYLPSDLLTSLDDYLLAETQSPEAIIRLAALDTENEVLIESFLTGKEFSCIVIRTDEGEVIALPPTEIRKGNEIFDYRAKYLAGLSSKQTPIDLPTDTIRTICQNSESLFNFFGFHTYARIDGFITADKHIYLNDPNTTSGMLPSSFFFHQAAEIGLNPSQFLTFIVRSSIAERVATCADGYRYEHLLTQLDHDIAQLHLHPKAKKRVGVVLGGYSSERHISVESGRNIYEKLSASDEYQPIPFFLTGADKQYDLYEIPINILLKDNADDIAEKIKHHVTHPITAEIRTRCATLIKKYGDNKPQLAQPCLIPLSMLGQHMDIAFIALHGRPGEDGNLQQYLEQYDIPYNGSGIAASSITINKYATNQLLQQHGFKIAEQLLVSRTDWDSDIDTTLHHIEHAYAYPIIAKPADDGCSSAVKKLKNRAELSAYCALIFRNQPDLSPSASALLKLKPKEEFPIKDQFLIETLIEKGDALHFLEVTGGLLTHYQENGTWQYEMFEPSETLASEEVLSLEEKFLAGEGQNITPARYATDPDEQQRIAQIVRAELARAAQIIGIEGYARIDAFVKIYADRVETYIIEINSLPGMTPATCIFHQCAINGYTPYRFIDAILKYGMAKQPKRM